MCIVVQRIKGMEMAPSRNATRTVIAFNTSRASEFTPRTHMAYKYCWHRRLRQICNCEIRNLPLLLAEWNHVRGSNFQPYPHTLRSYLLCTHILTTLNRLYMKACDGDGFAQCHWAKVLLQERYEGRLSFGKVYKLGFVNTHTSP